MATPTDVFAVPADAVDHSTHAYESRSGRAKTLGRPLRALSGGRLLRRCYVPGSDPGINDSMVPQQGPNYALAKRLQRWRAAVARRDGALVSMNVAPPTRTRSVVKNRALAAAYAGRSGDHVLYLGEVQEFRLHEGNPLLFHTGKFHHLGGDHDPLLWDGSADGPGGMSWFSQANVLPSLTRTTGASSDTRTLQVVSAQALTPGLALLDAPDIDSVVDANRQLAAQLLAAADLWLFVTTAARYADAVPWELLHAARERGTALALVLNRVPADATAEVSEHLARMLAERGLPGTELLVVPETQLDDGLLPAGALAKVVMAPGAG